MSLPPKRTVTPKRPWTTREEAYLRAGYADTPMAQLMGVLQRPATAIQTRAKVLGLKRSATWLASAHSGRMRPGDPRGQATHFKVKAVRA